MLYMHWHTIAFVITIPNTHLFVYIYIYSVKYTVEIEIKGKNNVQESDNKDQKYLILSHFLLPSISSNTILLQGVINLSQPLVDDLRV